MTRAQFFAVIFIILVRTSTPHEDPIMSIITLLLCCGYFWVALFQFDKDGRVK